MWLERLRDVLYPHYYTLGNISSVSPPLLPEWRSAVSVMKEWTKLRLFNLRPPSRYQADPRYQADFIDALICTVTMLFDFDRTYGWQIASSFRANIRNPALGDVMYRADRIFIVPEILAFFGGQELGIEMGIFAVEYVNTSEYRNQLT